MNVNFIRALMCSVCLPRQALSNPEKTIHVEGTCVRCSKHFMVAVQEHETKFNCHCGEEYKVSRPLDFVYAAPKPLPTAGEKGEETPQNTLH